MNTEFGSAISAIQQVIANIWERARINALAHKLDHERYRKSAIIVRSVGVFCTLFAIICTFGVYIVASGDGTSLEILGLQVEHRKLLALFLTVLSIVLTFSALFLDLISTDLALNVASAEHRFLMNSYQHIAQRAREGKWPSRSQEELMALLEDLERDFQLLKARGVEPSDKTFSKANTMFEKISADPTSAQAQSFPSEKRSKRSKKPTEVATDEPSSGSQPVG